MAIGPGRRLADVFSSFFPKPGLFFSSAAVWALVCIQALARTAAVSAAQLYSGMLGFAGIAFLALIAFLPVLFRSSASSCS